MQSTTQHYGIARLETLMPLFWHEMSYSQKSEMSVYSWIELIALNPNKPELCEVWYKRLIQANEAFVFNTELGI
jgi:dihydroorotase-like cyclic amidohydrolase